MIPDHEQYLLNRSRTALAAAENEPDDGLRAALLQRVRELHEVVIRLQLARLREEAEQSS